MHALQNLLTTFRRVFMLRDAVRRRQRVQTAEAELEGLESRQLFSVTNAFVRSGVLQPRCSFFPSSLLLTVDL
jgi:hypothetical protein